MQQDDGSSWPSSSITLITFTTMKLSAITPPFLVLLLLHFHASEAAISCSTVIKNLRPCVNYLESGSGKPPADCCAGASALSTAASTTADRRAACSCIKSAAGSLTINTQLAKALPENCGISFPFDISPDVDCSTMG